MGRLLLLRAAALLLFLVAGCGGATSAVDPAHPDLACVSCHNGGLADGGMAPTPKQTCTTADCHADGGPAEVQLATVTFTHRNHADTAVVQPSCAGCHSHTRGGEPLTASVDGCALCHVQKIDGRVAEGCQDCHGQTEHVALTSQGLPLPHGGLPWVENTCVRCHYDVAAPPTEVSVSRCQTCHTDPDSIMAQGMGTDLHPAHEGIACVSCHATGSHRIFAMSSSVALQCADCHAAEHDVELTHSWPEPETCIACHASAHVAEQALVLGIVAGSSQAAPAHKFLRGLTCRSCHVRVGSAPAPGSPLRGQPGSCGSCHLPQYDQVLTWWRQGSVQRQQIVGAYVDRARAVLQPAGSDSTGRLLDNAEALLASLRRGGVQHNVELADRLFREALQNARDAYGAGGRTAAPPPDLGPLARPGFCSYCHFRVNEPNLSRAMPSDFHEQATQTRRME